MTDAAALQAAAELVRSSWKPPPAGEGTTTAP